MGVALHVGIKSWEVGASSFLHCFFSTVAVRLEHNRWGSRYPLLMRELYVGKLESSRCADALIELDKIKDGLKDLTPDLVIWDHERREALPPWGTEIASHIKSLAEYFVTSDGKDLLTVIAQALEQAAAKKKDLTIE